MWQWCAVFVALFVLDYVWAKYTQAMTSKRAWTAAAYSTLIILIGGFSVVSYTTDPKLLIPAGVGAFLGTLVAVRWGHD